ncbi:MAG: hypothetical protein LC627_04885 [Verrucomicrobiaceae bacterium]|nr:hypothetical protein [Verrucomicrobiaceae bacterium]
MNVRLLESARRHLVEGFEFYEKQTSGLGKYFLDALFVEIGALSRTGGIHAQRFGFHRCVCARFPFAVYYLIDGNEVRVYAVLDCRRDPSRIRRELRH